MNLSKAVQRLFCLLVLLVLALPGPASGSIVLVWPKEVDRLQRVVTVCENPRPTVDACPELQYFREPSPKFCGLTQDGRCLDYVRSCEACMNSSVITYFNTRCSEVKGPTTQN